MLRDYRLKSDEPDNLTAWYMLRLSIIEDDIQEIGINESIHVMNSSIAITVCFMFWLLWVYFVLDGEHNDLSGSMLYLSLSFMGLIIVPIFKVLNAAVDINTMLLENTKEKLQVLNQKLTLLHLLKNKDE